VPCRSKPDLIDSVLFQAACKFGVSNVASANDLDVSHPARAWAMRELHRHGVPIAEIAHALNATIGVVQVALGLSLDELDDDEREVHDFRGPTRMLPVAGDRRDCALASTCLGELLRACAPASPHAASCPPTCSSFRPPPRPERAEFGAGLGAWYEADLPPDPERDNGEAQRTSPWAAQQARAGGRFARETQKRSSED
jgi:hypothetical protein